MSFRASEPAISKPNHNSSTTMEIGVTMPVSDMTTYGVLRFTIGTFFFNQKFQEFSDNF